MGKGKSETSIRTQGEFAEIVGRDAAQITRWMKREDWPYGKPPWNRDRLPEMLRWVAETIAPRGRPPEDEGVATASTEETKSLRKEKLRQEIRKLMAQADTAETALAKERGVLHDADECEVEAVRRASLFRNAIQNIPTQSVSLALSSGMPHEGAPGFQKQIEELVNGCLRYAVASANAEPETGNAESDDGAAAAGAVDAQPVG